MKRALLALLLLFAAPSAFASCGGSNTDISRSCTHEGEAFQLSRSADWRDGRCSVGSTPPANPPTYTVISGGFRADFTCAGGHSRHLIAYYSNTCATLSPYNFYIEGMSAFITTGCNSGCTHIIEGDGGGTCPECWQEGTATPAGAGFTCLAVDGPAAGTATDTDNDGRPDTYDDCPDDPDEQDDSDGDGVCDNGDPQPENPDVDGIDDPDSDSDGTPDWQDEFPENPNETTDTDDDGVGDNGDTHPGDSTNGQDSGDGNESDNVSSGGGDCNTPPTSTGDAIAASALLQLWKIRCAKDKVAISGEACSGSGVYSCTGDPIQCAQLLELRRARCASSASVDWTTDLTAFDVAGVDPGELGDEPELGDVVQSGAIDLEQLDDGGFIGGDRTCPLLDLPSLEFRGETVSFPVDLICDALSILAAVILLAAYIQASFILGRFGGTS